MLHGQVHGTAELPSTNCFRYVSVASLQHSDGAPLSAYLARPPYGGLAPTLTLYCLPHKVFRSFNLIACKQAAPEINYYQVDNINIRSKSNFSQHLVCRSILSKHLNSHCALTRICDNDRISHLLEWCGMTKEIERRNEIVTHHRGLTSDRIH